MRPAKLEPPKGLLNPHAREAVFHLARHLPVGADVGAFVENHWIVSWDLTGRDPFVQEMLPCPSVNVAFEAGASGIFGVYTRKSVRVVEGVGRAFAIKFRPGGFYPFLKTPIAELNDTVLPLARAFTGDLAVVERAVLAAPDEPAQIALVEDFLRANLPAPDANVAFIDRAVQLMLDHREIARVEDVAERVGMSVRTLQRLFRRYVGVGPKWVLLRYRLQDAAARLAEGHVVDQAALALELGYSDQAHFIKDFTAMIGRTPGSYAAMCAPPAPPVRTPPVGT